MIFLIIVHFSDEPLKRMDGVELRYLLVDFEKKNERGK